MCIFVSTMAAVGCCRLLKQLKPFDMKPIFLIGYMGCGKSTMGRALHRLTGMEFIDLDSYIETRFHSNVREIFATRGEDGFRDIERRMLHEVADFENVIVACGGGTPCFFDNMEYMNERGITVWLNTSVAILHSRLMRGRHKRPLIAGKSDEELREFIIEALKQRSEHYDKATIKFGSDKLETESEVAESAMRFASELGLPIVND